MQGRSKRTRSAGEDSLWAALDAAAASTAAAAAAPSRSVGELSFVLEAGAAPPSPPLAPLSSASRALPFMPFSSSSLLASSLRGRRTVSPHAAARLQELTGRTGAGAEHGRTKQIHPPAHRVPSGCPAYPQIYAGLFSPLLFEA